MHGVRNLRFSRHYSMIHFAENLEGTQKPRLRDFCNAMGNFFLLSSAVFMTYNAIWYRLEYKHVQQEVEADSLRLEAELQRALEAAKKEMPEKGWLSKFAFWK